MNVEQRIKVLEATNQGLIERLEISHDRCVAFERQNAQLVNELKRLTKKPRRQSENK